MLRQIFIALFKALPLREVTQTLTEGAVPVFVLKRIKGDECGIEGGYTGELDRFLSKLKQSGYECLCMRDLYDAIIAPDDILRNKVIFIIDGRHKKQLEDTVALFQLYDYPLNIAVDADMLTKEKGVLAEQADRNEFGSWQNNVFTEGACINIVLLINSCTETRNALQKSVVDIDRLFPALPVVICIDSENQSVDNAYTPVVETEKTALVFSEASEYITFNELKRREGLYDLPYMAFPEDERAQDAVICKFDYIERRVRSGTMADAVESVYGLKRHVFDGLREYIFYRYTIKKYSSFNKQRVDRLVFICVGNICRSPFAEIVAQSEQSHIKVISMGIEASGSAAPDERAQKIAKEFGYDMNHLCSSKVDAGVLSKNDLLVVMELGHIKRLKSVIDEVNCQVTLLGTWGEGRRGSIADPYGRSEARFRFIFSRIKESVKSLLSQI